MSCDGRYTRAPCGTSRTARHPRSAARLCTMLGIAAMHWTCKNSWHNPAHPSPQNKSAPPKQYARMIKFARLSELPYVCHWDTSLRGAGSLIVSASGVAPVSISYCYTRRHICAARTAGRRLMEKERRFISLILPPQAGGMESTPIPSITEYHEKASSERLFQIIFFFFASK